MRAYWFGMTLALSSIMSADAQTIDLGRARLVDLTHSFNANTLYWPTSPSAFRLEQLFFGTTPGGFFYSANAFAAPEHGGTHIDAPIHFARDGLPVDGSRSSGSWRRASSSTSRHRPTGTRTIA